MSAWRHQAFEKLPELRTQLQKSKSPYAFWIELQFGFGEARRKKDVDLFSRILDYADWCLGQPKGKTADDDLGTCVFCCFIEHVVKNHAWRGKLSDHLELRAARDTMMK